MIETGLFGGSFNPIHNGHIFLAEHLLASTYLKEIWFVVSPQNPLKSKEGILDDNLRLNLAKKALENYSNLLVSDYEIKLHKPAYTYLTLQHLAEDFPQRHFTLIIGADNWLSFPRWFKGQEIISNYKILVYPRDGYSVNEVLLPQNVKFIDAPLYNISSTEVRKRVAKGESIEGIVPEKILEDVEKYYKSQSFFLRGRH